MPLRAKSCHSRTASFRPEAAFVPKFNSRSAWFYERNRHAARSRSPKPSSSIIEVVFAPWSPGGRALQELRRVVTRLARGRALGRITAELGLQFHQIGEDVGLAPQFIGDHRRLARNRRDHGDTDAAALYCVDQPTGIA